MYLFETFQTDNFLLVVVQSFLRYFSSFIVIAFLVYCSLL